MGATRQARIREVFDVAVALPESERLRYVEHACAHDVALQADVLAFLQSLDQAGQFLANPTVGSGSATVAPSAVETTGARIGPYSLWDADGDAMPVADMGAFEFAAPRGDLDASCDIGLGDLAALLSNFGTAAGATYAVGDLDGDGDVDLSDLAGLLANFGMACP